MSKSKRVAPRTFVLGDLHGAYKALMQVLQKSSFDYQKDTLIFIGDLADGWVDWDKCLNKLLEIKNIIPLLGNHDLYLKKYVETGIIDDNWLFCGGDKTSQSILEKPEIIERLHCYFMLAKPYYIQDEMLFCHGGFDPKRWITSQSLVGFSTNRKLYKTARAYENQGLKFNVKYDENDSQKINEIFIGHSTTKSINPVFRANLINIDTGAGSNGCLTMMNVYDKTYVQSDKSTKLYSS